VEQTRRMAQVRRPAAAHRRGLRAGTMDVKNAADRALLAEHG
jgi:hypothetical protein